MEIDANWQPSSNKGFNVIQVYWQDISFSKTFFICVHRRVHTPEPQAFLTMLQQIWARTPVMHKHEPSKCCHIFTHWYQSGGKTWLWAPPLCFWQLACSCMCQTYRMYREWSELELSMLLSHTYGGGYSQHNHHILNSSIFLGHHLHRSA